MVSKFNLYDFLGYVLPGTVAFGLLCWFARDFLSLPLPFTVDSFGKSLLAVAISYSLGHFIQSYGNRLERRLVKLWGGWFSVTFLREDNAHYTARFKANLAHFTDTAFDSMKTKSDGALSQREVFDLCYSLVVQQTPARHVEVFNGMYGLYRGFLAATWLGIGVSAAITLKSVSIYTLQAIGIALPNQPFFAIEPITAALAAFGSIGFIALRGPIQCRLERFARRFADAVYRSFYAWYIVNHRQTLTPPQE